MMKAVSIVARKEIREALRDGRAKLLAAVVVMLAVAALVFGLQAAERAEQARNAAQEHADEDWQGQGEKNPHVAAHYGTHLFAPTSAATAIDPGVTAFLGRSVKVEAHRRNLATHAAARDAAALQRMGTFSVASVLLLLAPLLIIVLGYGAWSRERERGTMRQLLSSGVDRRALLLGKAGALAGLLLGLLAPLGALIVVALWIAGGGDAQTLVRLVALAALYFVYFGVFAGSSLLVSAWSATSQGALVALLAMWGLLCLGAPRIASEAAGIVAPLPSAAAFHRQVQQSLEHGIDGKTPREKGVEALTEKLLKEQGLEATGMLVAAAEIAGVELQAEAQWEDAVFDHHMARLQAAVLRQEQVVQAAGWLSPLLSMRALSAAICGTDLWHHQRFSAAAEAWRKQLVGMLNRAFAEQGGAQGWKYKAGPELWKKAPAFAYQPPTLGQVLAQQRGALAALLLWFVAAMVLAWRGAAKVKAA